MDYRTIFQISAAGMNLEKRRVDTAALNLANMHSSVPPGQAPYAVQAVLAEPLRVAFGNAMERAVSVVPAREVRVVGMAQPPRLVHEPGHPHADTKGFVAYASVDQGREMITLTTALRAYEANVAAASLARAMTAKALELGGP